MNKTYSYNGYNIHFERTKYIYGNNALALVMVCDDGSPYAVMTVNLEGYQIDNEYHSFVDTNNLGEELVDWIIENKIGFDTGIRHQSGYCIYPLIEFNKEFVNSLNLHM